MTENTPLIRQDVFAEARLIYQMIPKEGFTAGQLHQGLGYGVSGYLSALTEQGVLKKECLDPNAKKRRFRYFQGEPNVMVYTEGARYHRNAVPRDLRE